LAVASVGRAAEAADPMISTSSLCTKHFARLERQYGIPKHLMMAVGGTESGRWSNEAGMAVPWPWTINAEGKGQYFNTLHDAVTAVRRLQERGVRSIDIGCMQVNLKHHPKAFTSLTEAFDPAYNTTYAAQFLRRNYDDARSWSDAVAAYHSKGTKRGRDYFGRVKYNWRRVLAAVRGESLENLTYVARGGEGAQMAALETERPAPARAQPGQRAKYRSPSMKIITVSQKENPDRRGNEVLVIRPSSPRKNKQEDGVMHVASNEAQRYLDDQFVTGVGVKKPLTVIPIAAAGKQERVSSRRNGPNFIFN
jgi:hypothetical protein